MANNVSIATKPLVYSAFRYINNKVWNALAEYIDNSIQSFLDHKETLQEINPKGKLTVELSISDDSIVITDNAYGITEDNYQRAFELANIPLDAKGLNEFGMGMKVSSIWLSDIWSVVTSAYGEPVKKTMTFNIKEVTERQETELPVLEESAKIEDHYTVITLKNLSLNRPTSRQIAYIKKHIASIYTKYLREGLVDIIINGEYLQIKELKVLNAPYYKDPKGEPVLWQKEIHFSAPRPYGEGLYKVDGFIGILETMSTDVDNGFLLFRRGRVIGSSYDDRYRPSELSGQSGSPRHKRIFGELHLEGFEVSFTKNSFQEDDDFHSFIMMLKEYISEDKNMDLFGQVQNYTKPKTAKEKRNVGEELVRNIAEAMGTVKEETQIEEEIKEESESPNANSIQNISEETATIEEIAIEAQSVIVKLSSSKVFRLSLLCENRPSCHEFYTLRILNNPDEYEVVLNLSHPLFEKYGDQLSGKDGMTIITEILKTMVASEFSLTGDGSAAGGEFRNKFNKLFGRI